MPLFSVVIPTYNRAKLVAQSLDSVFSQTFEDYEVIVVDDGSTDDTPTELEPYRQRIHLIRQTRNRGPGAARNAGIQAATGEYITFLDADDIWLPWTLEVYAEAVARCARPSFIAGRETKFIENRREQRGRVNLKRYDDYYSSASENIWIPTCATAITRNVLQDTGGFIEDRVNAEDSDLWLRLGEAPGFVQIVEPTVFAYRRSPGTLIGNRLLARGGIETLIAREKAGRYPGGSSRSWERRKILGRHIRAYVASALQAGELSGGLHAYLSTFRWAIADRRFKFLVGFWLLLPWAAIRRAFPRHTQTEFGIV